MRFFIFLLLNTFVPVFLLSQAAVPGTALSSDTDTIARPTLLIFSGSDWCQPCIRFEKKVLNDKVFQNFAATNLEVVKADFPQRKKLPPAQTKENERLAGLYNPEGKFPYVVLLRPDRTLMAVLATDAENGAEFIAQIRKYLPQQ